MPTYVYACDACGGAMEEFRPISQPHPASCSHCGEPWGEFFRQDFHGVGGVAICYGNPTTAGQQAEINARRMGKEQMQMMAEQSRIRPPWSGPLPQGAKPNQTGDGRRPWFRDGVCGTEKMDAPLDLSTVRNVEQYVATGKK